MCQACEEQRLDEEEGHTEAMETMERKFFEEKVRGHSYPLRYNASLSLSEPPSGITLDSPL